MNMSTTKQKTPIVMTTKETESTLRHRIKRVKAVVVFVMHSFKIDTFDRTIRRRSDVPFSIDSLTTS